MSTDVVVVGGGIIGFACAMHLAQDHGLGVTLLERDEIIGQGATGKCAGGIRQQFSSEINIRLSMESVDVFNHFEERYGFEVDYGQYGYLFMLNQDKQVEVFQKNIQLQRSLGLEVEWCSPEDILKHAPYVQTDGLLGGTFCASDGYGDPHGFLNAYATLSRRLGVDVRLGTAVESFDCSDVQKTVHCSDGSTINCQHVLLTAGAWSSDLAAKIGLELPIKPYRRQIHVTNPFDGIEGMIPLTIDFGSGVYWHRESGGILIGAADPDEPSSFNESVNEEFMETIVMAIMERAPVFEQASIKSSWGGLYAITPDHNAILGEVPGQPGLFVASGFSGHGFMHAPAVGRNMAALIATGKSDLDLSPLSMERFSSNLVAEFNVF